MQQRKDLDIGIWSSCGVTDSQTMVQHLFGQYLRQLLFVTCTERPEPAEENSSITPKSMPKNLANIWAKYPQYNEENTLVLSNNWNEIEDFQRNDIVLPEFEPKFGRTDFLNDMHMNWF